MIYIAKIISRILMLSDFDRKYFNSIYFLDAKNFRN